MPNIAFNIKIAICLIFAAATLSCHSASSHRVCMPSPCPGHARVHEGWRRFRFMQGSAMVKETKFNYQLVTG